MTKNERALSLLQGVTGGITQQRLNHLHAIIDRLTRAEIKRLRIEECTDEKTGVRYGEAVCRRGRCAKIGGGGRNKGSKYAYQLWAVWA